MKIEGIIDGLRIGNYRLYSGRWVGLSLIFGMILYGMACQNPYKAGANSYKLYCASCHMDDGSGLQGIIPPLAGADYLHLYPERLPCIITQGMSGPVTVNGIVYDQPMPAVEGLDIVEIANILNYIQHRCGDPNYFYDQDLIKEALQGCD